MGRGGVWEKTKVCLGPRKSDSKWPGRSQNLSAADAGRSQEEAGGRDRKGHWEPGAPGWVQRSMSSQDQGESQTAPLPVSPGLAASNKGRFWVTLPKQPYSGVQEQAASSLPQTHPQLVTCLFTNSAQSPRGRALCVPLGPASVSSPVLQRLIGVRGGLLVSLQASREEGREAAWWEGGRGDVRARRHCSLLQA